MARLGKGTDSPIKIAVKKAKRVAAKARQDLVEEFKTETPKTAHMPNPDAVDVSPAQIPRKPKVVPASSLAPPSPTAQVIQDRSIVLHETVTIPIQSFAPLPVQDSTCDNLSVPTIRSRMNYYTIPIQYAYLMDVEDYSSEDELRAHVELFSENRRQKRRLARKIKELNANEESKKAKKPEDQYRRDALDQKTFASEFTGKDSHMIFREDLKTETFTRQNWRDLIKIKKINLSTIFSISTFCLSIRTCLALKNCANPTKYPHIATCILQFGGRWALRQNSRSTHICQKLMEMVTLYCGTS